MIESTTNTVTYVGNGAVFSWATSFRIDNLTHIRVFITEIASLSDTEIDPTEFTATGIGNDSGATITYPTSGPALTSDYRITIDRILPVKQEYEFNNQGGFFPNIIEDALDKLTMMMQQLETAISRNEFDALNETIVEALEDATAALTRVVSINSQAGAGYTFTLTDPGKLVEGNSGTAQTFTIPANSSVAIPVASFIDIVQSGVGQITFAAAGGVVIQSSGGKLKMNGQFSRAILLKRNVDTWILTGDIVA